MLLLLKRGSEDDEKEDEDEEKEEEVNEEEEEEELSFLLSRKLSRVSMSKSILLSDGFTVAVLEEKEIDQKFISSNNYSELFGFVFGHNCLYTLLCSRSSRGH